MIDGFLVPENTTITAKGDGEAVNLGAASNPVFLLSLKIAEIVEQESLDVNIFGSADGTAWDAKPLVSFPQKFYRGESPLLLDLTGRPEVKFVRAHWEVNRWGRGPEQPMFALQIGIREVPAEILTEARKQALNPR